MAEPKPLRPRRLRRDEQRHQTRAQLLDAAERVFAREGLRGASVAAIAAEAGYSHGAIYSNFDGKEDLFLMLVEERIDARLARVYQAADAALSQGSEPLEAARRVVAMLQQERDAVLLLVDFWNPAVRDQAAAVVGFSNGGPHAAACAYKLGMRVSGTALVAPMPPLDAPGALRQLGVPGWYYPLARRAPWALRTVFAGLVALAGRDPRRAERVLLSGMSEPDRRLFSWPEWAGRFGADLAGAGSHDVVDDERPMPLPWGSRPNRSGAPCACGSASTTSWSRRACGWSGPAGFPSATRPWCPAWAIS